MTYSKPKRVAIYARVSTSSQTVENQFQELREVAQRNGWQIVAELSDSGISGAKGRDQRPAFDQLLKRATRREFDLIMVWAIDRLGRSIQHLIGFMNGERYVRGPGSGAFVPRAQALVSVFDSGFLMGDAVWEGMRLYNGKWFCLDKHLRRLYEAAKFMDMDIGLDPHELRADQGCNINQTHGNQQDRRKVRLPARLYVPGRI